jgi:hypothetical protein
VQQLVQAGRTPALPTGSSTRHGSEVGACAGVHMSASQRWDDAAAAHRASSLPASSSSEKLWGLCSTRLSVAWQRWQRQQQGGVSVSGATVCAPAAVCPSRVGCSEHSP